MLNPFDGWISKRSGNFAELSWWTSYNRLKHNRTDEIERSTLSTAVAIISALNQVIAGLPTFMSVLFRKGVVSSDYNPRAAIEAVTADGEKKGMNGLVETKRERWN